MDIITLVASLFADGLNSIVVKGYNTKDVTIETIDGYVTETVVTDITADVTFADELSLYTRERGICTEYEYMSEASRRISDHVTFHWTCAGHRFWRLCTEEAANGMPLTKQRIGRVQSITVKAPNHHSMIVCERPATQEEVNTYNAHQRYLQNVLESEMMIDF